MRQGDDVSELPDCTIAEGWFNRDNLFATLPECRIDGKPASTEQGLAEAARLLSSARSPIVYGLSRTTTPAQRAAVQLADRLGAVLDLEISSAARAAIIARSRTGWSTATLGEIRTRSDLVVLWCDASRLTQSFPRIFERYTKAAQFVHVGTAIDDNVLRANPLQTQMQIQLEPSQHCGALSVLLRLLRKKRISEEHALATSGHGLGVWSELLKTMQSATYGTALFDGTLESSGNYELLFELVRELNLHTRFVCTSPTETANLTGATHVLTWSTGYPFGINFAGGASHYSPLEFQAEKMWQRREVDATCTVASDPLANASTDVVPGITNGPLIAIDWRETATTEAANVAFFTDPPGCRAAETAYRFDGVPLPMRSAIDARQLADAEVLQRLCDLVRVQKRETKRVT